MQLKPSIVQGSTVCILQMFQYIYLFCELSQVLHSLLHFSNLLDFHQDTCFVHCGAPPGMTERGLTFFSLGYVMESRAG